MGRGGHRGSRKTLRKQACPSQTVHGKQFSKQVPEGKDVAGRGNAEGAGWEKKLRMNKGADYPVLARALFFGPVALILSRSLQEMQFQVPQPSSTLRGSLDRS